MNRPADRSGPARDAGLSIAAANDLARVLCTPDATAAAGALRNELAAAGWVVAGTGLLDPRAAVLFGTDVGGTKMQSVIADLSGRVLAEIREPTATGGGPAVIDQICRHRAALLARSGLDPAWLRAAAVGVPGAVDPRTGRVNRIPNIAGIEALDLAGILHRRLGLPLRIENDVNLAACGEGWLGQRSENLVFIALGTGIGMGVLVNGQLVRGARGAAGEIAALPIGADPFDPATFATGALESRISSAALVAAYLARGGIPGRTMRDLFAAPPDPAFAATVADLAHLLARAVLSVCAVLDPEKVVIGGGIGSHPDLLAQLNGQLARCMPGTAPACTISVLGNRAGVLGAIWSARLALAATVARA